MPLAKVATRRGVECWTFDFLPDEQRELAALVRRAQRLADTEQDTRGSAFLWRARTTATEFAFNQKARAECASGAELRDYLAQISKNCETTLALLAKPGVRSALLAANSRSRAAGDSYDQVSALAGLSSTASSAAAGISSTVRRGRKRVAISGPAFIRELATWWERCLKMPPSSASNSIFTRVVAVVCNSAGLTSNDRAVRDALRK
jgi:hypothetical protein